MTPTARGDVHRRSSDLHADSESTVTSAPGTALLSSLSIFVKTLATTHIPESRGGTATATTTVNEALGKELLTALERFIGSLTESLQTRDGQLHGSHSQPEKNAVIQRPSQPNFRTQTPPLRWHELDISQLSVPRPNPVQPRPPPELVEKVYNHVFNMMPIRILAFDSNGSKLRLLERNVIAPLILSRVLKVTETNSTLDDEATTALVHRYSRYAILSHTWLRDLPGEVVYADWKKRTLNTRGNNKITGFCKVAAREHGVLFGWMDSVCIDKNSSTELDESIRSMYRWYQLAHVCVTYLADTLDLKDMHKDTWFTRGWTLQELLAPRSTRFYGKNWRPITSGPERTFASDTDSTSSNRSQFRFSRALTRQIVQATTITASELGYNSLPISRLFQLAAQRSVTREEDRIYSLMGLLGVGITVAYGEGEQSAFNRLFRELLVTKEHVMDIFNHSNKASLVPSGISDFLDRSVAFEPDSYQPLEDVKPSDPITMTHLGIRVPLLLVPAFAFRRESSKEQLPPHSNPRIIQGHFGYDDIHSYSILDDSESSVRWLENCHISSVKDVIFYGILNFQKQDEGYTTYDKWLCVIIGPARGSKILMDLSNCLLLSGPVVVIPKVKRHFYWSDQLKKHGMQVRTLLLK